MKRPWMLHVTGRLLVLICAGGFVVASGSSATWAQEESPQEESPIGFVIAKKGQVFVTSPAAPRRAAGLRQKVFIGDVLETGPDSATKVLFDDNSLLSLTANTKIEIAAYRHKADRPSRFEIRTPTAVTSIDEANYVVWTFERDGVPYSGVAVTAGSASVTNVAGQSKTVEAGQFTVTARFSPPTVPAVSSGNRRVQRQVQLAQVKTDQTLLAQVTMQVAQQREKAQRAVAGGAAGETQDSFIRTTVFNMASGRIEASVPELPIPPNTSLSSQQLTHDSPGGVSPLMGTTNTPCLIVSSSGNLPLGCTP